MRRDGTAVERTVPTGTAFLPEGSGVGDSPVLGPYRLRRRLAEGPCGIVWLGEDGAGNQVSVIAIWPHVAAVRGALDRLRALLAREAVEAAPARAPVVAADLEAAIPWIATPYDGRIGAERFLDRWDPGFSPPPPPPGVRPGFRRGFPAGFPSAPPGPAARRTPRALWVALIALGLLGAIALAHFVAQELRAIASHPPSVSTPGSTAAPGRSGTTRGRILATGMGFTLRLPAGWSCTGGAAEGWSCNGGGASLQLLSQPCRSACGPLQQWRLLEDSQVAPGVWRPLGRDAWTYQAVSSASTVIDLATFWNPAGGPRADTEVLALGAAPTGRADQVRELEEQVRLATG